jgi:hypothetical protein
MTFSIHSASTRTTASNSVQRLWPLEIKRVTFMGRRRSRQRTNLCTA